MTSTIVLRHRIYFSITLQERVSLDELAAEVSSSLGVVLMQSSERGTMGDFEGEALGLQLWLHIAQPPAPTTPALFALVGGPPEEGADDAVQIDIGAYVAEILAQRTGRAWVARTP
jgi:hypothetical protein